MKNWYQVKVKTGLTHRRTQVKQGQKIYLSDAQAKLHGESKLSKTEPPKKAGEAAVKEDLAEYEKGKATKIEKK